MKHLLRKSGFYSFQEMIGQQVKNNLSLLIFDTKNLPELARNHDEETRYIEYEGDPCRFIKR